MMGLDFRNRFVINSKDSLEKAVEIFEILPFFPNYVRGLSVEEMCAPGMLFGGNFDDGCWEWKGPVIRSGTTAYGKFFNRKAGFVSLNIFPDFLNFRRKTYPITPDSTEEMILEIIRENDSLSSTELKQFIFGSRKRTRWDDLPEVNSSDIASKKSKSLEGPLQKLQMGGRIIISDFQYKLTKRGERYGWGVARYSTPELFFGDEIKNIGGRTAEESLDFVINAVKKKFPSASRTNLEKLLR